VNALVVGAGAVGSLVAWALATGGASVTLVRRRAERAARSSLTVIGPGRTRSTADVATAASVADVEVQPDVVVLAVRTFDVAAAVESMPSLPGSTLVTIQNGIGTEDLVRGLRPASPLVAASLTAAVDLALDGSIHWLRRGGIGLASVDNGDSALRALVGAFGQAGLRARTYRDWRAMKWSKLIANLVGNATSALADLPVSEVYAHPGLFEIEREQLREAFEVVRALGLQPVSLPGADVSRLELAIALPSPVARTILGFAVGGGRGGKDPSLRLALAGRADRTEVEWLNGAVARTGSELEVRTPVNRALTRLVTDAANDPHLREGLRGEPDALVAAIDALRQPEPVAPVGPAG
jgi:2-dehydropantoate 2-reductase